MHIEEEINLEHPILRFKTSIPNSNTSTLTFVFKNRPDNILPFHNLVFLTLFLSDLMCETLCYKVEWFLWQTALKATVLLQTILKLLDWLCSNA